MKFLCKLFISSLCSFTRKGKILPADGGCLKTSFMEYVLRDLNEFRLKSRQSLCCRPVSET